MFGRQTKAIEPANPKTDPNAEVMRKFMSMALPRNQYAEGVRAERAMIHPVIFRCLHRIGLAMSGIHWYAAPDPDLPIAQRVSKTACDEMNAILNRPTPEMTGALFRYWAAIAFAAYGRIPVKVGIDAFKRAPNAFWPLDPSKTNEKRSSSLELQGYDYGNQTDGVFIPTRIKADRDINGYPRQPFAFQVVRPPISGSMLGGRATCPLQALGIPADIVLMLMQRAHDTASGHPNSKYIIATEKLLGKEQQATLNETVDNRTVDGDESGNILLLQNTQVQVHKLDNNLSDLHSKMPADDMARHICGTFGIPVSLMGFGAADGAKFASNYEESRLAFYEDTMIPEYCTPVADAMTDAMPRGMILLFDYDKLPVMQARRARVAKDLEAPTFMTDDEKREVLNLPAIGGDAAKLPPKPSKPVTPTGNPAT